MEHLNCSAVVPVGPTETNLLTADRNLRIRNSSVGIQLDIFNSMSFDVYVVNRQNMKFKIPRTPTVGRGKLIFVKGFSLSAHARSELLKITTTDDISNSKELSHLIDKWEKVSKASVANGNQRSIDEFLYIVDEATLRSKKCVYIREVDYVVSMDGHIEPHPYSHQGQLSNRHTESQEVLRKNSTLPRRFFTWNVFTIDNAGRIGSRWINFHGCIYRINSVHDPSSKDGFYVVRDKPVSDALDQTVLVSEFHETETDLDFPVYKTYQEALAANDSETMVKLKTTIEERRIRELDLEHKSNRAEADASRLTEEIRLHGLRSEEATQAHERELAKHEREMQALREQVNQERLKAEQERVKFNNDRERFEHEKITQGQKNSGETIKVIGTVITGVLGLLMLFSKLLK